MSLDRLALVLYARNNVTSHTLTVVTKQRYHELPV